MGVAEDYGFDIYLTTPLDEAEEKLIKDRPTQRARTLARRIFNYYLDQEIQNFTITNYDDKHPREILALLDQHFGAAGIHPLILTAQKLANTMLMVDSYSPSEFARIMVAHLETMAKYGGDVSNAAQIGLIGCLLYAKYPEWYTKFRSSLSGKNPKDWMTTREMIQLLTDNTALKASEVKDGHALFSSSRKNQENKPQDKKKKKKTKHTQNSCPRHPRGNHTDKECRLNPNNSENSQDNRSSKEVTFGPSGHMHFTVMYNAAEGTPHSPELWYVDSGASFHMTPNREYLQDYTPTERIYIDGTLGNIYTEGKGTVTFNSRTSDGAKVTITIKDVYHVIGLKHNLIAVSQLLQYGVKPDFVDLSLQSTRDNTEIAVIRTTDGVYYLFGEAEIARPVALHTVRANRPQADTDRNFADIRLWHKRFAHVSPGKIREAVKHSLGLELRTHDSDFSSGDKCTSCWRANPQSLPYKNTDNRTSTPGDRIHADLIGPIRPTSIEGYNYVLLVVDDATRHVWTRFLTTKKADEVLEQLTNLITRQFNNRIKALHIDGGSEFNFITKTLEQQGTEIRITPPHSPSSNGLAERWNGIITARARAMLLDSGVPQQMWPYAYQCATYVSNRLPTKSNKHHMSPHEAVTGRKPRVGHLVAFGALAHVHLPQAYLTKSQKMGPRTSEGVFLGYHGESQTIYKVWLLKEQRLFNTRDVRFDETIFPALVLPSSFIRLQQGATDNENLRGGESPAIDPSPTHPITPQPSGQPQGTSLDSNTPTPVGNENPLSGAQPVFEDIPPSPHPAPDEIMTDILDEAHESQLTAPQSRRVIRDPTTQRLRRTNDEIRRGIPRHAVLQQRIAEYNAVRRSAGTALQAAQRAEQVARETSATVEQAIAQVQQAVAVANESAQGAVLARQDASNAALQAQNTSSSAVAHTENLIRDFVHSHRNNRPDPAYNVTIEELPSPIPSLSFPQQNLIEQAENNLLALVPHSTDLTFYQPMDEDDEGMILFNRAYAHAMHTMRTEPDDPNTFRQAMKTACAQEWKEACDEEMKVHRSIPTYHLANLPRDTKALPSRWILRTKYAENGSVARRKARWVVCGNFQDPTEFETFSAVASAVSLRVILAYAALNSWHIRQADVTTAFLHGRLHDEDIYVRLPDGYQENDKHGNPLYAKLDRALYGLRHAPRRWFECLESLLTSLDFHTLDSDSCVFMTTGVIILLHVDDMLILGPSLERITEIYDKINAVYPMKGLDEVSTYLGMKISSTPEGVTVSQAAYVRDILARFDMRDAHHRKVPMTTAIFRDLSEHPDRLPSLDKDEHQIYLKIVGSLQWLSCMTRPDIAFATSFLARYSHKPTTAHLIAAKGVLRYLASTPSRGLSYLTHGTPHLEAYTDAAFADHLDRKSTSAYLFKLASSPVSWRTVKQTLQAGSTADAEYVAATLAAKETKLLVFLMAELPRSPNVILSSPERPIQLFCDSTNAIAKMSQPARSRKSLHLDAAYHYVHEATQRSLITPVHVSTHEMAADGLTKPLDASKFPTFVHLLGLGNLH